MRFRKVGLIAIEPAQAGLRIGQYGRQRLIDLVNDGPGELTHRGKPRCARQLVLRAP